MPTVLCERDRALLRARRRWRSRVLFLNGSGSTLATMAPLIEVFASHLDVVAYDQTGPGPKCDPSGPLHHGRLRLRRARAHRRRRVVHVSRRRGELRRDGGPGAGGDRSGRGSTAWPSCARRPGAAGERRIRSTSWPAWPRAVGPRSRCRSSIPGSPPSGWRAHPRDRMLVERHGAAGVGRRCPTTSVGVRPSSSKRAATTTSGTGSDGSRARPSWAPGRFDGIAPLGQQRGHRQQDPGCHPPRLRGWPRLLRQDRRALPEVIEFLRS